MTPQEQEFWDKAVIAFAAALMTKEQSFMLQSETECVYTGIHMADLLLEQRRLKTK